MTTDLDAVVARACRAWTPTQVLPARGPIARPLTAAEARLLGRLARRPDEPSRHDRRRDPLRYPDGRQRRHPPELWSVLVRLHRDGVRTRDLAAAAGLTVDDVREVWRRWDATYAGSGPSGGRPRPAVGPAPRRSMIWERL